MISHTGCISGTTAGVLAPVGCSYAQTCGWQPLLLRRLGHRISPLLVFTLVGVCLSTLIPGWCVLGPPARAKPTLARRWDFVSYSSGLFLPCELLLELSEPVDLWSARPWSCFGASLRLGPSNLGTRVRALLVEDQLILRENLPRSLVIEPVEPEESNPRVGIWSYGQMMPESITRYRCAVG